MLKISINISIHNIILPETYNALEVLSHSAVVSFVPNCRGGGGGGAVSNKIHQVENYQDVL